MVDPIARAIVTTFQNFGSTFKQRDQALFFKPAPVRAVYLCPGTPFRYPFTCILTVYETYITIGAFSKFFDPLFDAEALDWFLTRNSELNSRAVHMNPTLNGLFSCMWINKETIKVLSTKLLEVLVGICEDFEKVANYLDFSVPKVNNWLGNCGLPPISEDFLRYVFATPLWQDLSNVSGEVILKHKANAPGMLIKAKLYLSRALLEKATTCLSPQFTFSLNVRNRSLSIKHADLNSLEVPQMLISLRQQCIQTIEELERPGTDSTQESTFSLSRIPSLSQQHLSRNPIKELKLMRQRHIVELFLRIQPQVLIPFLYTKLEEQGENAYLHFKAIRWYEAGKTKSIEAESIEETKDVAQWLILLHSKGIEFQQFPFQFLHYVFEPDLRGFKLVPPISEEQYSCFELVSSLTSRQEYKLQIRKEIITTLKFNQEWSFHKFMNQFPPTDQIDFGQFTKQSLTECTELGKGGFGVIFLNEYRNPLKPLDPPIEVALKVIKAEKLGKQSHIDSLMMEYKILRNSQHDNIIKVYGYTLYNDTIAIVMDYCSNKTLSKYIVQESDMPMYKRLKLLSGVANGMAFLHSKNLAHLDIKPQNILVNGEGVPKISDFGLSKKVERGKGLEKTGYTLLYSAPEQLEGSGVNISGDVWAFGNLMYYVFFCKGPNDNLKSPGENIHSFSAKKSVVQSLKEKKIKPQIPDLLKMPNVSSLPHGFERDYPKAVDLMRNCWQLNANARPEFKKIQKVLEKLSMKEEEKLKPKPNKPLFTDDPDLKPIEESKADFPIPLTLESFSAQGNLPQQTPNKEFSPIDVRSRMMSTETIPKMPITPGYGIQDNPEQKIKTPNAPLAIKNSVPGTVGQPIESGQGSKITPNFPEPLKKNQTSGEKPA